MRDWNGIHGFPSKVWINHQFFIPNFTRDHFGASIASLELRTIFAPDRAVLPTKVIFSTGTSGIRSIDPVKYVVGGWSTGREFAKDMEQTGMRAMCSHRAHYLTSIVVNNIRQISESLLSLVSL